MTNWKIYMSMSSFMIAAVEFLNIKDHYNPDKMTPLVVYLVVGFVLTIGIGFALIISVLKTRNPSAHRS